MNQQIVVSNQLISYKLIQNGGEKNSSIIFLHGWRSNKEIWLTAMSQLPTADYQLFAIDLPGFGGSQLPTKVFTIGDYAEIVVEFIKKLDLKNTIIVGHSFGGRVGIKLAAQYPAIVAKLVLVDSAGFSLSQEKKSVMNLAAKIARPFFKPKFMQGLRKKIYGHIGAEDYLATPELQQTFVNVVNEDLSEDMKKINCPTLIITGEKDMDTPVEFGIKMHSLIPNSKFLILPNAGHFSFLDKPEEFTEKLKEFIL
jgi:pimeloyl-ACP methyl ester carboxylesterase